MVIRGAEDKACAEVFGECASTLWLFVEEGLHDNRDKVSGIIVVWAVHMGVGGKFGV